MPEIIDHSDVPISHAANFLPTFDPAEGEERPPDFIGAETTETGRRDRHGSVSDVKLPVQGKHVALALDLESRRFGRILDIGDAGLAVFRKADALHGGMPLSLKDIEAVPVIAIEKNHAVPGNQPYHVPEGPLDRIEVTEEWYNYLELSDNIEVVLTVDETTFIGGKMPDYHPIAWYQENFEGGRSFHTALGHPEGIYDNPWFRQHILGAVWWAATGGKAFE